MFGGCDDIPTQVKLIYLSEGDDVDPFNVITADLNMRMNTVFSVQTPSWTPQENTECVCV